MDIAYQFYSLSFFQYANDPGRHTRSGRDERIPARKALVAHNYCYLGRNCGRMHFQRVYVATSSFAIE